MDGDITCNVCGGTHFYKESGFYFCEECQTQTQEIVERVLEDFEVKLEKKATKKLGKKIDNTQLNEVKLTTWECYNYVIKGLTEELIVLGADHLLYTVVKKLWMKYLSKIEVSNSGRPKLQAVNSKIDAEIVYGKRKKRRKKRRSRASRISDSELSSLDSSVFSRERSKRRRALMESHYNESMSKSMDGSQFDETLKSVKSSSGESSHSSIPLQYNKYAMKELVKQQSEEHLSLHMEDFENTMTCHNNSYLEASKKYQNSPHLLSINKIYSILYLGLLMTKSKVQLSDMLRFIREGHLSFNNFKHFFPEEMQNNFLTQVCPRKLSLISANLRRSTIKIAKFLDVLEFIEVQNLVWLVNKFCKELNLPSCIEERTLSLLMVSLPKMKIRNQMGSIPNYEGRVLSLILFQLKLYFGIDGKSEIYFSDCANSLNKNDSVSTEMFDFMKWMQYLDYRIHVLKKLHFPSQFAADKQLKDSHLFTQFVLYKNPEYNKVDPYRKQNKDAEDCRDLLLKLIDDKEMEEPKHFEASLNASMDYIESLLKDKHVTAIEREILSRNFRDSSIDFITNFTDFSHFIHGDAKVITKLRGANTNLKLHNLVKTYNTKEEGRLTTKCTLVKKHFAPKNPVIEDDAKEYLENFKHDQKYNLILPEEVHNRESNEGELEIFHYKPHMRHWVNTNYDLGRLSKKNFEEHLSTYPYNFQFILEEMARIGEQSKQDLLYEFSLTEIYLLYSEAFDGVENGNFHIICDDDLMMSLLKKAKKFW